MRLHRVFLIGFLTILIPVWVFFLSPELIKLPTNFRYSIDIDSIDDFYNPQTGSYEGPIRTVGKLTYRTRQSNDGVLMIESVFDARTAAGNDVVTIKRLLGVDIKTGKHVPGYGSQDRTGYLFAPRNLKPGDTFTYWHINYDGPAQMRYITTEKIYGLQVHTYQSSNSDTKFDQTENLTRLPGVGKTLGVELEPSFKLWIEPKTGMMIKYEDDTVAYFYDIQTGQRLHPWNHFSNSLQKQSIINNVNRARLARAKILLIEQDIPFLLTFLSILYLMQMLNVRKRISNIYSTPMLTRAAGVLIMGGGAASLLGWMIGSDHLIRIFDFGAGMNPLTAICFLLLGLAIIMHSVHQYRIVAGIGIILMTICALRIANEAGIVSFSIDLVLFRDAVLTATFPARMPTYTMFSFFLLGISFVTQSTTTRKYTPIIQVIFSLVFIFSCLVLIGYFFHTHSLLDLPLLFLAAIHTAILFLLSSVALHIIFQNKMGLRTSSWLAMNGVLLTFIFITISLVGLIGQNYTNAARADFTNKTSQATDAIINRMDIYTNVLRGAQGLFASSDVVERDEWHSYVEAVNIEQHYPGIQSMGYSVVVKPDEVAAHTAALRAQGFPDYTIHPAGKRDIHTGVIYLEPFEGLNRQELGLDMLQDPVRSAAMKRAHDTGEPQISGRVMLTQETDNSMQAGFFMYAPHYKNEAVRTPQEYKENIMGYVYGMLHVQDFVEGIFRAGGIDHIALTIYDGMQADDALILYDDSARKIAPDQSPRFKEVVTTTVAGHDWTLMFQSEPDYGQTLTTRTLPITALIVAVISSILVGLVFYFYLSSRQRAIEYSKIITKDLDKAKNEMEKRLQETERINRLMINRELKMVELKKQIKLSGQEQQKSSP